MRGAGKRQMSWIISCQIRQALLRQTSDSLPERKSRRDRILRGRYKHSRSGGTLCPIKASLPCSSPSPSTAFHWISSCLPLMTAAWKISPHIYKKILSLCCEICYNITDRPVNPGIPGSGILRVRGKGPCGFRKTASILKEVKKRGERCLTNG